MTALYTVIAAIVVKYLVDVVKALSGWIASKVPQMPNWVKNLIPLWKLLTAIAVTILVVWGTKQFAVELEHPLMVLVIAQIAHEATRAVKKTREES
jgi:hypothetical protein